ncbi:Bsd2p Ecym_7264 [Eremothecium cymbalariae DBVPG|uniref:Uncharacterized protein n=1 Tax=Eremothecium cymbalariae (strain CBS 270.75 / DBVPG 7215 / KCTC 17166 / NRRL Y-17582) TaxID=931890 RepID=G8JW93_ERECY|nr:hypothetical protein Ecym_7264 [Eremothecium cymbalariae DBVPG\
MNGSVEIGSSSRARSPATGVGSQPEQSVQQDPVEEASRRQQQQETEDTQDSTEETVRSRLQRHLDLVARHFNILDRLFKRNRTTVPFSESHVLQFGAHADGVFSNLTAKPESGSSREATEGDKPPTYDEAAADMAPPYYGIDDDGVGMYYNEICIDGLPVGNIVNFLWNLIISVSFQFVGFLLTYILHTSHAAKQGSRFGLGLTFMGYGYSMIPNDVTGKVGKGNELTRFQIEDPNNFADITPESLQQEPEDQFESHLSHGLMEKRSSLSPLAVILIVFGFAILIKSIYDYVLVKKMERQFLVQSETQTV